MGAERRIIVADSDPIARSALRLVLTQAYGAHAVSDALLDRRDEGVDVVAVDEEIATGRDGRAALQRLRRRRDRVAAARL